MDRIPSCLGAMLTAKRHKPTLVEERRRVLLDKARRASFVLAGLSLAWSLVDWLTVPGLSFYWLLLSRLVAASLSSGCIGYVPTGPSADAAPSVRF